MKITKIELTKIEASEGMTLYNGKYMGKVILIFLGNSDKAENWCEITDAEAEEIRAKQEAVVA